MSDQRTMSLTRTHCSFQLLIPEKKVRPTIPHPYRTISAPTGQRVSPKLYASNEILIHFPSPVRVWRSRHCELLIRRCIQ